MPQSQTVHSPSSAMLEVETRGPEAEILARALKELIDGGFGEEV